MNRLGIDLGGTKIEAILIDEENTVLQRKRVPTLREEGYDAILERIVTLAQEFIELADIHTPIGVCTPGAIDMATNQLKNSNTVCLIGKPIKTDLEEKLQMHILLENDANCFALAETLFGAAKGYQVVFGVIMGTGVGGGIIVGEKIHRGANHIAGEWGHHILYPGGKRCYCGNRGCVETYISGTALENEWESLTGKFKCVTDIFSEELYHQYPEWKENLIRDFGRSLANVVDILDPDAIVLGGGLSKIDTLYTEGVQAVYKEAFSEIVTTPVLRNRLGDSAGVFGAAMLGGHV